MPRGGKRPGAGRPKGSKEKQTLTKEAAREALRKIVLSEMEPMTRAQIKKAKGLSYFVARDKRGGAFKRLRVEPQPGQKVGAEDEIVEIWHEEPSTPAYTDLMNRAVDKPKEQEQDINVRGVDELAARLAAGRKRAEGK